MANVPTNNLTRGDKIHKKKMDKLNALKDPVIKGFDSFTKVHKQIIDSDGEYLEKVANFQKDEKAHLYEIIKTSDDEKKREEALKRLDKLDDDALKMIKNHNELSRNEGEKADKNIINALLFLAGTAGLLHNRTVRQKVISVAKKCLPIK